MSEYFSGITFPKQNVAPSDDACIRRAVLADGVLTGCEISYVGSTLTFGAGLLIGCGRQFRHTAVQNFAVTGATSGFARLVVTIDTTLASTKDTFEQISVAIEYATAQDGFQQLRQDDINEAGTVYQMQICVVSLSSGGISGIVSQIGVAESGDTSPVALLWENASPTSAFAAQTVALDMADIAGVFITYRNQTAGSVCNSTGFVGKGDGFALIYVPSVASSVAVTRKGTVDENGVNFLENSNDKNEYHIPLKIYGVRGTIV